MKLYGYFRSSAAFRVRIALNLKGIDYEHASVHLVRNEQHSEAYRKLNPQQLVPTLEDGPLALTQSLAIVEYLEETHPEPHLLPADPAGRARVRALALSVACDIHPLDNLRVLRRLKKQFGAADAARDDWYRYWIAVGFEAIEATLARDAQTGRFCHGDAPTLADVCLVPQVFNARRYNSPLEAYPTILRTHDACMALEAFRRAAPQAQPDAE